MGRPVRVRAALMGQSSKKKKDVQHASAAEEDEQVEADGKEENGETQVSNFDFLDIVDTERRVASVDVEIPWYIIDPQGHNIKKQRLRRMAQEHLKKETDDKAEFSKRLSTTQERRRSLELERRNSERGLTSERSLPPPAPRTEDKPTGAMPPAQLVENKLSYLSSMTLFPFWDSVTTVALLFTVIVTPFEVGFLKAPTSINDLNTLFFINRVVDAIFIVDGARCAARPTYCASAMPRRLSHRLNFASQSSSNSSSWCPRSRRLPTARGDRPQTAR